MALLSVAAPATYEHNVIFKRAWALSTLPGLAELELADIGLERLHSSVTPGSEVLNPGSQPELQHLYCSMQA